jgi:5-(carboxyamino)imidazole ribonucleotide mutase
VERKAKVIIVMGSDSDLGQMKAAADILGKFDIPFDIHVSSAHRTPEKTHQIVAEGEKNGVGVFIAAAGGAAHLAGVVASATTLPVIGVPVSTKIMGGMDSLLSTVQMPSGIPVATVAIGGAKNAGILAAQILSLNDETLREKLKQFRREMAETVAAKDEKLSKMTVAEYLEQMNQ